MKTLKFVCLDNRQVLKISGEEARDFLQGLVSNDLTRVSENQAIYAALLSPQGKYLHDFFIAELDGDFYLDCESARVDDLFKRLRMFKLRAKVDLELIEDMAVVALFGELVHDALSINATPGSALYWLGGILFTDPRLSEVGARAILPRNALEIALQNKKFNKTPLEEYDSLRLSFGLPDSSRDMEVDKTILLEVGFDELNGVDFNKGCYVGQELTARTKHRGLIKKRLIPVSFVSAAPATGTKITQDGKNAGELRSTAGSFALALLRLDALQNLSPLLADGVILTPHKPPWANF
ncbi:MAG: CAF17-like 4Fe-4S cluster assembly/insertion protein YgfZ [Rhodospirillales bacterium]|jgi:folate-binding protein YgfZ